LIKLLGVKKSKQIFLIFKPQLIKKSLSNEQDIQDEVNPEEYVSIGAGMWDITKISISMMISVSMSFMMMTSAVYLLVA
jgi:hypothetical protein